MSTRETYDLMNELNLLDPGEVRLVLDEFEELYLVRSAGERVGPLAVQRAFPINAEGEFIALKNREGEEVGVVRRVAELERESRAVLEAELERSYFMAEIVRINSIEVEFHVPHWDVITDRGPRVFELRSSRRDVRALGGGRVLVRDADGNQYEIPDYRRLEPNSRGLIEAQI